jgi:DNA replication protein DnaC
VVVLPIPGRPREHTTASLLDRLTHRCQIFEINGESYRFRESMKSKKTKKKDQTEDRE